MLRNISELPQCCITNEHQTPYNNFLFVWRKQYFYTVWGLESGIQAYRLELNKLESAIQAYIGQTNVPLVENGTAL